jgi:hypothetical protein
MMRVHLLLVLFLASVSISIAQEDYTYISDRRFFLPSDLIGYDFRPNHMEVPNDFDQEVAPGEYSFGISSSNLYVEGENIRGVYSVNNINPTEYGYKLLLMNARDPRIQGHLKVILNRGAQVEALVFKKSKDEPEIIFFQSVMDKGLEQKEMEYFTDNFEVSMAEPDSVWGMKLYPFMRIHRDKGNVQERLQASDSTSLEFIEKVTIIEKKKKKKRRKKERGAEEDLAEVITETEGESEETLDISEIKTEKIPEVDPGAYPPIESAESVEAAIEEEQEETVKVKIIKEYFLNLRTIVTYDDGTVEDVIEEIPIKEKFTLYETQSNDSTVPPFEMEITPKKGDPIMVRLNKDQSISSISIWGKEYLMRGH